MNNDETIARGRRILEEEARAILKRSERLDESFAAVVERLLESRGHAVLTGVGKSGIIGAKIAATLSSTGTRAFFLKPVEALHGDLGMVSSDDVLIPISASGETAEVLAVVEAARPLGVTVVAMTGKLDSSLARAADLALDVGVDREACPLGIAPTASTTVTLAVGDALAMVLLERRGFTREHYLRFHPGGALGERLRFLVRDLLRSGEDAPRVPESAPMRTALDEMTRRDNIGVTLVVDSGGALSGVLTDGDVRRALLLAAEGSGGGEVLERPVAEFMGRAPKTIEPGASAAEAVRIMEVYGITSLAVVDPRNAPLGLVHLHDILGRGKFRV